MLSEHTGWDQMYNCFNVMRPIRDQWGQRAPRQLFHKSNFEIYGLWAIFFLFYVSFHGCPTQGHIKRLTISILFANNAPHQFYNISRVLHTTWSSWHSENGNSAPVHGFIPESPGVVFSFLHYFTDKYRKDVFCIPSGGSNLSLLSWNCRFHFSSWIFIIAPARRLW